MSSPELYTATGTVFAKTKKAIGFRLRGSAISHWIPLSQVCKIDYSTVGHDTIVLKAWLAKKLGFM